METKNDWENGKAENNQDYIDNRSYCGGGRFRVAGYRGV